MSFNGNDSLDSDAFQSANEFMDEFDDFVFMVDLVRCWRGAVFLCPAELNQSFQMLCDCGGSEPGCLN